MSNPSEQSSPQSGSKRGLILTAVVTAILTAVGTTFGGDVYRWVTSLIQDPYRLSVQANTDRIIDPQQKLGQSYITERDATSLPPPPDRADSCLGRYNWAHSNLKAVDADSTAALVTIRAVGKDTAVIGARPVVLERKEPTAGNMLTCPGQGAPPGKFHSLSMELGSSAKPTFTMAGETTASSLYLPISRGHDERVLVSALAPDCTCRWLLELALDTGGDDPTYVSVGPEGGREGSPEGNRDQPAFITSSSLRSAQYRFLDDGWQLAAPPPPRGVCELIRGVQLRRYFGEPAEPGSGPIGYCSWSGQSQTNPRQLQLHGQWYPTIRSAQDGLKQALDSQAQSPAAGSSRVELGGAADRMVAYGNFVWILRGQVLYDLSTRQGGSRAEIDALVQLGKAITGQLPAR